MCQVCEVPLAAVDYIESKRCHERQQTGSCSCLRRKGRGKIKMVINPCQVADDLVQEIYTGMVDEEKLVMWLQHHRCRNPQCNHRPCATVDNILDRMRMRAAA